MPVQTCEARSLVAELRVGSARGKWPVTSRNQSRGANIVVLSLPGEMPTNCREEIHPVLFCKSSGVSSVAMTGTSWYYPSREKCMSQHEQDAIRGRLMREQTELQSQVGSLAAKLNAAGQNFSRLGDDLQRNPPVINVSKEAVEKEKVVSELWTDIANYNTAAADLSKKKAEFDLLG